MKFKEKKVAKNLNKLLYEESQLENSNKLPLQEIEENLQVLKDNSHKTAMKRRNRKKISRKRIGEALTIGGGQ